MAANDEWLGIQIKLLGPIITYKLVKINKNWHTCMATMFNDREYNF